MRRAPMNNRMRAAYMTTYRPADVTPYHFVEQWPDDRFCDDMELP